MSIYEVIIRLISAIIVGGLVGYEREHRNRPAGFRTHILVCVGACVISMIQLYEVEQTINMIRMNPQLANALKADVGRLGAQVVSGIGFLGAGTIVHQKGSVKGLTTAASLWVVACIGLAVGLGYYALSALATIAVVIVLVTLKKFESRFLDKDNLLRIEIGFLHKKEMVHKVDKYFKNKNIEVKNIEFLFKEEECGQTYERSLYTLLLPKYLGTEELTKDLASIDEVVKVTIISTEF